jgi:hypothetical protein
MLAYWNNIIVHNDHSKFVDAITLQMAGSYHVYDKSLKLHMTIAYRQNLQVYITYKSNIPLRTSNKLGMLMPTNKTS